jgi:hypothetical protein
MAVLQHPLTVPLSQLGALRSAMRDVQVAIGDYYGETGRTYDPDALATRVRSCVGFAQVLNELLRKQSGANIDYRAMFDARQDPRVGIIQAFEYARHLTQHVLHPVRPKPSTGGSLAWVAYGALVAAARELGEAGTTSYLATALPAQLRDAAFAG